ncbi:MAG: hypothetical protein ACLQKY_01015 [Terracidiphilus sp.]
MLLGVCVCAQAQETAQQKTAEQPASEKQQQVPRVPGVSTFFRGFDAGISFSGVHNSLVGWYEVATPAISYTFSSHYSADASAPIYLRRLVENPNQQTQSSQELVLDLADGGDTLIGFHASFFPRSFRDTATFSLTAPTGNRSEGLGTGKVTVDFTNHVERYVRQTGFLLDLGIGDSSGLVSNLVTQNYNSVGTLAHFQTGAIYWLHRRYYLESVAYEDLPVGSQTVYLAVSPPLGTSAFAPPSPYVEVLTSTGASEDNGFTTEAGIPLSAHFTLSGYYNRSLRHHLDTVSVGMTYVVRQNPIGKRLSMIDRALRVAAGLDQK